MLRIGRRAGGAVLGATLLLVAGLTGCDRDLVVTGPSSIAVPVLPVTSVASVPIGGRVAAELHVVSGFTTLTITTGDIGDDLVRATAAAGSRVRPAVSLAGNIVAVGNAPSPPGGSGPASVALILNPSVRWQLSLDAGATAVVINLAGGSVSGVDVAQGVSSLQLTLPPVTGTTVISIAAGVSSLIVHLHGHEPVRATLSSGAGSATIDGGSHSGIAAGSSFTPAGWASATDRVDVACSAGVGALVIDRV